MPVKSSIPKRKTSINKKVWHLLSVNCGGDNGLFEGGMFGHVDGHFKLGQNVFGDQERLMENLVEHGDGDVPITEHGRLGQLKFRREDSSGG